MWAGFHEVLRRYWDLGFTSFGGPGVHVIILRKRFVDTYKWVDSKTFLDLFALGNALPGPGSTQLAFSIAVVKHGVLPGLLAFLLWSIPGAIGMTGLAFGVARIPDTLPPIVLALLSGLNAAAVGLIALAAIQLLAGAGTDRVTLIVLWLSASFGICYHAPWMYPTLIASGGITTLLWDFRRQWIFHPVKALLGRSRRSDARQGGSQDVMELQDTPMQTSRIEDVEDKEGTDPAPTAQSPTQSTSTVRQRVPTQDTERTSSEEEGISSSPLNVVSPRTAALLLLGFVLFLTIPLATRAGLKNAGRGVPRALDFFCNMVIAGTIIFGGGPVVIPLLRDYVVVEGWVSSRDFLLVFAILQAFPGPNFNFATAIGVLAINDARFLGAILGYIGIFAPGIILKLALLPLYSSWRDKAIARSIIRGLNAAASGLVFTAVWQLFLVGYIYQPATGMSGSSGSGQSQTLSGPLTADPFWAVVASGSYLASRNLASPPWLSIIGGGIAGLAWYGVTTR